MNAVTQTSSNPLARMARAVLAWFDTAVLRASTTGSPGRRPHRLGAHAAVHPHARGVSVCVRGRREPGRHRRLRRALLHPHVRDHRFLSPLFLAQVVQDLARRPVPVRRARRLGRAARADLVGRASSRPSPVFRQERRRALAHPARLRARAHELVPVEERLRARSQARARPHELPRAALARPLRHHRAGAAGRRLCSSSASRWKSGRPASAPTAGRCSSGASSSRPCSPRTAPTRSTRCRTSSASSVTRPATRAATTGSSR